MMKVLAAEMSDPSRLRRGKQYAKDGSVLDIIIEPGIVTCEIQGSRSTPYIAAITVKPGDGMPLRRDIDTECSCPDDDNWDGYACKHVVAAMFTLSDEFLLEPELLDVWRNRTPATNGRDDDDDDTSESSRPARHLRLVRSAGDERPPSPRRVARTTPRTDPVGDLLRIPAGTTLPDIADIEHVEPSMAKSRELATVLRDAIANLRIDWE